MTWLKNVIVDLLVVIAIIGAVFFDFPAARWVVIVYTPLMLVLKAVAYFGGSLLGQFRQTGNAPPGWFFHTVYGLSVALLLVGQWWIMAAAWAAIWGLSVLTERRLSISRHRKTVRR
ncbi:MAG: hypothetical protein ACOCTG_02180 [Bacteroidota bacterium]